MEARSTRNSGACFCPSTLLIHDSSGIAAVAMCNTMHALYRIHRREYHRIEAKRASTSTVSKAMSIRSGEIPWSSSLVRSSTDALSLLVDGVESTKRALGGKIRMRVRMASLCPVSFCYESERRQMALL